MRNLILFQIALRNLVQARRRTGVLFIAVATVTAMLVLLQAMSQGINDNLVTAATTLSAGQINVAGFYKATPGSAAPIVTEAAAIRKIIEENTPDLDYTLVRHRSWGKAVSETGTVQAGLAGLIPAEESRFFDTLQLAKESDYFEGGRDEIIGDPRQLTEPHTMVVFANQAKKLGVRVGDVVTFKTETQVGRANTLDLKIVAVAKDLGLLSSFSFFTQRETVLELGELDPDTTGAVWVYLKDINNAPEVMAHLRSVLLAKGYRLMDYNPNPFFFKFEDVQGEDWTGQKLDLTLWKDEVSFLSWVIIAFDTVTWFLTTILVAIITIGIMNAMWQSVRERTREIGTMRAVGMSRLQTLWLFLIEALLLGLFSTVAGAAVGVIIALAVDAADVHAPIEAMASILLSDSIHLSVKAGTVLTAIVFLTGFTGLSALWPAIRAALLQPVKALAHIE